MPVRDDNNDGGDDDDDDDDDYDNNKNVDDDDDDNLFKSCFLLFVLFQVCYFLKSNIVKLIGIGRYK